MPGSRSDTIGLIKLWRRFFERDSEKMF